MLDGYESGVIFPVFVIFGAAVPKLNDSPFFSRLLDYLLSGQCCPSFNTLFVQLQTTGTLSPAIGVQC